MVRGLNVMKGYYKNPEATEAALDHEGWLHTAIWVGSEGRITVLSISEAATRP